MKYLKNDTTFLYRLRPGKNKLPYNDLIEMDAKNAYIATIAREKVTHYFYIDIPTTIQHKEFFEFVKRYIGRSPVIYIDRSENITKICKKVDNLSSKDIKEYRGRNITHLIWHS